MFDFCICTPHQYEQHKKEEEQKRKEYLEKCRIMSKNIKKAWAKKQL